MKISAVFESGDIADCAVREMKNAGISILSKKTVPLDDFMPPTNYFAEKPYYPPSGMDIMGMATVMMPYDFPQTVPPMGIWGDEPLQPHNGGRTRLEITVDDSAKNQVHGILVANNASDIHFYP